MSLSYRGKELLKESGEDTRGGGHTLKLIRGRRYGFLGDNGCGKTTLLRRFAAGTMPGFPRHLRTLLVVRAKLLAVTVQNTKAGPVLHLRPYLKVVAVESMQPFLM